MTSTPGRDFLDASTTRDPRFYDQLQAEAGAAMPLVVGLVARGGFYGRSRVGSVAGGCGMVSGEKLRSRAAAVFKGGWPES